MAEPITRYLLDSVILIDHFNGIATRFLHEHKQVLSISVITCAAAIPVIPAHHLSGERLRARPFLLREIRKN